jgi:hypothetical protein
MWQHSLYLGMRIHDTGLAGKACEFLLSHLRCTSVHVNLTSNPLLAETFEMPELKFISEKVSHNPVIIAYHAEGEGWEMYATSSGRTKFWGAWRTDKHPTDDRSRRHTHLLGKSLEIIPLGTNHVKIGADHYQW